MSFLSYIPQCDTWLVYIGTLVFAGVFQLIYTLIRGKAL